MDRPFKSAHPKVFCTTAEAAEQLGVSIRTVQNWSETGLLEAWKTEGGHRRIILKSLEKLLTRPKPATAPQEHFRMLVVEDDPSLLLLYQARLRRWPMAPEVALAEGGLDALLMIGQAMPHLLVTDLLMPDINGFEMLRKLRSLPEFAGMEIVAVSGLSPLEIAEQGGLPGGVKLLPKPIPFDELERIASQLAFSRCLLPSGQPGPGPAPALPSL